MHQIPNDLPTHERNMYNSAYLEIGMCYAMATSARSSIRNTLQQHGNDKMWRELISTGTARLRLEAQIKAQIHQAYQSHMKNRDWDKVKCHRFTKWAESERKRKVGKAKEKKRYREKYKWMAIFRVCLFQMYWMCMHFDRISGKFFFIKTHHAPIAIVSSTES